jgi:hypothetical protein
MAFLILPCLGVTGNDIWFEEIVEPIPYLERLETGFGS